MVKAKTIERSATVAWSSVSSCSSLLATGTIAGAMDASFSVSSCSASAVSALPLDRAARRRRIVLTSPTVPTSRRQVSGTVEIHDISLNTNDQNVSVLGSVEATERFHRLAWGKLGEGAAAHPCGVLAGGLVDGTVQVKSGTAALLFFTARTPSTRAQGSTPSVPATRLRHNGTVLCSNFAADT